MPTGVAVSPAMNHGGPYPATGHPGFTAVGIPASLRRFAVLQCYDNVRQHRRQRDNRERPGPWRVKSIAVGTVRAVAYKYIPTCPPALLNLRL